MNIFKDFQGILSKILGEMAGAGELPKDLDLAKVTVEPPRERAHGDMSTNAAMVLAKQAGRKPRDIAEALADRLEQVEDIVEVEVAGPGFVNWRLADAAWHTALKRILTAGQDFGASDVGGGRGVNVEYVSANPTGPLTVGHARGAIVGDVLANLLAKAGFNVTREYYTNDAGGQVDTLARSAYLRYREALGETIEEIPEGLYPGAYLKDVGKALAARDGDKWMDADEAVWLPEVRAFAIDELMKTVRADLKAAGVDQEVFASERQLVEAGAVEKVVETLSARDLLYQGVLEPPKGKAPEDWEPRPQTLFKATEFGDDTDRPIRKSDGSWTYFAADMAYHLDKYRRGHPILIDVLGADHGGYVKRMKAAVNALTEGEGELHVLLCQLVKLSRGGDPVKMSKRSGNFVTLREVVDEVGKDVLRFIMLTRKSDAQLEFDLEKVMEQSKDNPVFYVQYAHARCHSVLRHAVEEYSQIPLGEPDAAAEAPLDLLTESVELDLIKQMAEWPRTVEAAAQSYEPHRIAFYLNDLAASFHAFWNMGKEDASLRFLLKDDLRLTGARLALIQAVATVIASGLKVLGVTPVEEMR